eukprot:8788631-Lingulodinium_polyedra.AAC.1
MDECQDGKSSCGTASKRRRMISDKKESDALTRCEAKYLAKDMDADLKWLAGVVREDPSMMITVKAAVQAKLKSAAGERLYRGNRTLGSIADKHLPGILAKLTNMDISLFKNCLLYTSDAADDM